MIADYLYNTPSLTTETGAFVLLTQQFADVAALNSALLGKTLAQIRELSSVLGTADTEVKQFGFCSVAIRRACTLAAPPYRTSQFLRPPSSTLCAVARVRRWQ